MPGLQSQASMERSPTSGGTLGLLAEERAKASFDIQELREALFGQRANEPPPVDEFSDLFDKAPFNDHDLDTLRSYEDLWRVTMKRTSEAIKIIRENPKLMIAHRVQRKVNMHQLFNTGSLGIHFSMFRTFIMTQANDEQKERWMKVAESGHMFGAYAQTELGHGSNLRGLETTATFDRVTDEFVIHSPYLTSLKWWPTGMYCCTHGAVMANLVIDGKNYGFHGFMVQFRTDQGTCMPGVEIGEMGPKINATITNIGYARFTHVRIPRSNMFARAQQVTREGEYIKAPPKLSKFKYISMMEIRRDFVNWSADRLGKAATIAIRYSCVRKQGYLDNASEELGENPVLNYKMQQYRLFKALSLSYMFMWNGRYVADYLGRVQKAVMAGDEAAGDELPMLHATLCGFKVFSTITSHANVEECRKACGGQGFLLSSGIANMPQEMAEPVTAEGEQVILSQQLARFLVKEVRRVRGGSKPLGQVSYLDGSADMAPVRLKSYEGATATLLAMMKYRAAVFAGELEAAFTAAESPGQTFEATLNKVAVLAWKTAEVHSFYAFTENFHYALETYVKTPGAKAVLSKLLELTLLQLARENGGDFIDILNRQQLGLISDRINDLLSELRPDAVALCDAFGFEDSALDSTLGRFDGAVYEAIYEEAKKNPLNQSDTMLGWEDFSQILNLDFLREGMQTQRAGAALGPHGGSVAAGTGPAMAAVAAASKL